MSLDQFSYDPFTVGVVVVGLVLLLIHRHRDRRRQARRRRNRHPLDQALNTEHWKNLREWVYNFRAYGCCERCGVPRALPQMILHHVDEVAYQHAFQETPEDVLLICRKCHGEIHAQPGAPSRVR